MLDCVYLEAQTDHTSPLNNTCSRGNEKVAGDKEGGMWEKHNCRGLLTWTLICEQDSSLTTPISCLCCTSHTV